MRVREKPPGVVVVVAALVMFAAVILPVFVDSVRLLWSVLFCLLVPGSGWAYRSGVGDLLDRVALAVVISMSATILVSTFMAVNNWWSVPGGVAALAVFALVGYIPFTRIPPVRR